MSQLRHNLVDLLNTKPHNIQRWLREGRPAARYHEDRDLADDMPIYISYVETFTDDASGNVSKQWNRFENQYLSHRNLPREMIQMQNHVHFLSASSSVRANEQFGDRTDGHVELTALRDSPPSYSWFFEDTPAIHSLSISSESPPSPRS